MPEVWKVDDISLSLSQLRIKLGGETPLLGKIPFNDTEDLDAYLGVAGIGEAPSFPLRRTTRGRSRELTDKPMHRVKDLMTVREIRLEKTVFIARAIPGEWLGQAQRAGSGRRRFFLCLLTFPIRLNPYLFRVTSNKKDPPGSPGRSCSGLPAKKIRVYSVSSTRKNAFVAPGKGLANGPTITGSPVPGTGIPISVSNPWRSVSAVTI